MTSQAHPAELLRHIEEAATAASKMVAALSAALALVHGRSQDNSLRRACVAAAAAAGIELPELTGQARTKHLVDARKVAALLGNEAGRSAADLGRALNRDHTTVLALVRSGRELRAGNAEFLALYRRALALFDDPEAPQLKSPPKDAMATAVEPPAEEAGAPQGSAGTSALEAAGAPPAPAAAPAEELAAPAAPQAAAPSQPAAGTVSRPPKRSPLKRTPSGPVYRGQPSLTARLIELGGKGDFTYGEALADLQVEPATLEGALYRLVREARLVQRGRRGQNLYGLPLDRAAADAQIAEYLAAKGATKCPPAYAAPVTGAENQPGRLPHYQGDQGGWKRAERPKAGGFVGQQRNSALAISGVVEGNPEGGEA